MKLIAENDHDNRILTGLTLLLRDIGVNVSAYSREEAVAATFWSADDFIAFTGPLAFATRPEREAFLLSIEDILGSAMLTAGYETIMRELDRTATAHKKQSK